MYCACQVRKMTVDNLGPFASAMNCGKYRAQNDVCSFDYSTSVWLIRTDTDKAFFCIVCPIVSLQSYAAVIIAVSDFCRLQTADCRPQTADCRLQTADCRLHTADCRKSMMAMTSSTIFSAQVHVLVSLMLFDFPM